jgi:uncharacterized membrane protein YbhN (UPF0104 family)
MFEGHALCLALVAVDVGARALRFREALRALGHALPLRRAIALSLAADAASAVTPFRLGGDVARVVGLERAGVPRWRAVAALVAESLHTWPVVLLCGALLAWLYGGAWWTALRSARLSAAAALLGTAIVVAIVVVLWRRRPPGRALLMLPLSAVALGARLAILPVLVWSWSAHVPSGPSWLASFALVHGPLLLPTPSGAGAVDLGLLAAVPSGGNAAVLLVFWRIYTSGLGAVAGAVVLIERRLRARVALSRARALRSTLV